MKDEPNKEKKALELLSEHESIINFISYFENHNSYNFVFELCSHGSLDTFIKGFETMPIELVTYYTA